MSLAPNPCPFIKTSEQGDVLSVFVGPEAKTRRRAWG